MILAHLIICCMSNLRHDKICSDNCVDEIDYSNSFIHESFLNDINFRKRIKRILIFFFKRETQKSQWLFKSMQQFSFTNLHCMQKIQIVHISCKAISLFFISFMNDNASILDHMNTLCWRRLICLFSSNIIFNCHNWNAMCFTIILIR